MRNCEPVIPGLKGLKPGVLQTPQPLSKPGGWEAMVPIGPCTKQCCVSTKLVTKLHEQVGILGVTHDFKLNEFRSIPE